MKKILIIGAGGRMGRRLVATVMHDAECCLAGAIESPHSAYLKQDAGLLAGEQATGVIITSEHELASLAKSADAMIDFSLTESSMAHVRIAAELQKPLVLGTTGHDAAQKAEITALSKKFPLVMASNMSVGVNVMWRLLEQAAKILGEAYDVEIVEAHHRFKADAPSGTAMSTAEVLAKALNRDLKTDAVYHREGLIGARKPKEIGIQTIRGGDIVGDHTIYFAGIGERLEITHRASSRDTFAQGAVRAAKWIIGKAPGLYNMQDVLGLN